MQKICVECKTPFDGRANARYCSKRCKSRFNVRRHRAKTGSDHVAERRTCIECDTEYTTVHKDQKYCSDVCRDRAYERKKLERAAAGMAKTGLECMGAAPRECYDRMVAAAKSVGLPWTITFESWWRMWSPHWNARGAFRFYRLDLDKGFINNNVCVMTVDCAQVYYEEPFVYEEIV